MPKRNKLQKFADLLGFPNVYENFDPKNPILAGVNGQPVALKGEWAATHFQNDHPITLELACGRGEYTIALARMYPQRNFIGVDVKGARIWKGARIALDEGLPNAAFLRSPAQQLSRFFAPGEVDEIWITFPDPFLKERKARRRLTSIPFLQEYQKVIRENGVIHLKTDEPNLFAFTLDNLAQFPGATLCYQDADIYAKALPIPELAFRTYYENMHLAAGKTIKYVKFQLTSP